MRMFSGYRMSETASTATLLQLEMNLKTSTCGAEMSVVDSQNDFVDLHDRQNVLLRRDVLCAEAFWREE